MQREGWFDLVRIWAGFFIKIWTEYVLKSMCGTNVLAEAVIFWGLLVRRFAAVFLEVFFETLFMNRGLEHFLDKTRDCETNRHEHLSSSSQGTAGENSSSSQEKYS